MISKFESDITNELPLIFSIFNLLFKLFYNFKPKNYGHNVQFLSIISI